MASQANETSLVESLASQGRPVRPLNLKRQYAAWLVAAAGLEALALWLAGIRQELPSLLAAPSYAVGLVLLLTTFLWASWIAWTEVFPGRESRHPGRQLAAVTALAALAVVAYSGGPWGDPRMSVSFWTDLDCCIHSVGAALVPNLVMLFWTGRAAPQRPLPLLGAILLASTALVVAAGQLTCPFDEMWHVLIGHGVLVFGFHALTLGLYRPLLARIRRENLQRRLGPVGAATR